ncbi:hypothetical protein Tco_1301593 [Tanacetum coccineum]
MFQKFVNLELRQLLAKTHEVNTMLLQQLQLCSCQSVELSGVTCGGAHSLQICPATHGNSFIGNISEYVSQADAGSMGHSLLLTHYNPREDCKGYHYRSGGAYQGPPIPTSSVVKAIPR